MLPTDKVSINNRNQSITWKSDWIASPYESVWGILEKFKFANAATSRDIFQIFGTEKIKNNSKVWSYKTSRELYEINSLEESLLFNYLSVKIKTNNEDILNWLNQKLYFFNNFKESCFSTILRTCPECMKRGFHSIFHQVSVLDTCPFHSIKLIDKCPNCNREHYYEISDKNFQSAFNCVCGYFYGSGEIDYSFTKKWNENEVGKIKDKELLYLLDINKEQERPKHKVYFDNEIALSKGTQFFKYINTINDIEFKGDLQQVYRIHQRDKIPAYYEKVTSKYKNIGRINDITEKLILKYKKAYKTIARFIRNHLIKDHKFCINSYVNKKYIHFIEDGEVCPYAYAYVMWRQSLENLDNFWYVHRRHRAKSYCPPGWNEQNLLYEKLIKVWMDYFGNLNSDNEVTLIRSYEKIISILILNHYINWVKVVDTTLRNGGELNSHYQIRNEEFPFYYIIFSDTNEADVEIRYWTSDLYNKYLHSDIDGFRCPFKSAHSRRRDKGDLTHKAISIPAIYSLASLAN